MDQSREPNRLINEKSPYLLQHARNPVDWYPWGGEAFARARAEEKPIFLSVGYSTCHWCHVMERESFENEATARILNDHFVSIKVDREERPDIDRIYMTALQAMGQNGGWPMSMFLTPDLIPFYGGTYFPPESRQGRAGFPDILQRIHSIWEDERQKVDESAGGIAGFLADIAARSPAGPMPQASILEKCFDQFSRMYDADNGGFGGAPKFPRPVVLTFLLRYHARTGEPRALEMVERTLRAMAAGGIYDHLGGGFHRYSVDGSWRVPHFEKMLYDQAQLVSVLADTFQVTRNDFYAALISDVLEYVNRDMTAPDGGFFSAEDADSPRPDRPGESGEGAFYLWTSGEIREILDPEEAAIVADYFGILESGNAPFDPQQEFVGKNILYVAVSAADVAERHGKTKENVVSILARARELLFAHRQARPRPLKDDKILTSWNSLMISASARAFQVTGNAAYVKRAERSARFVIEKLLDPSTGTLRRRFRDGEAGKDGNLDDYAFLVQALLDLYESNFDLSYLERAVAITETQIRLFWDDVNGGFFESPGTDPTVIVRLKEQYDGAEPAGNSISVMNLLRLTAMTGRTEFRGKADQILALSADLMDRQPVAMPQMIAALEGALRPPRQTIIAGRRDDPGTARLIQEVRQRFLPGNVVLLAEPGTTLTTLSAWQPSVGSMATIDGRATAYVCQDFACELPTNDPGTLAGILDKQRV